MSTTDTPRTDAFAKNREYMDDPPSWSEFSEALERELNAARAENERLRSDLARFTGYGLLDCHAICDQRDKAVLELAALRADRERLVAVLSMLLAWEHKGGDIPPSYVRYLFEISHAAIDAARKEAQP